MIKRLICRLIGHRLYVSPSGRYRYCTRCGDPCFMFHEPRAQERKG